MVHGEFLAYDKKILFCPFLQWGQVLVALRFVVSDSVIVYLQINRQDG